ncbi:hypothetical protein CAPTEDRAFT_172884 [Capitella teleta]|uniref:Fucosyltransferase n=1 Tax=Capitella teleta TaxID=283909 RepID=R7UX84_CAPTE|nr:hypothetical protein CAPTEDRAFT_172884 [Capitella teleta]|eukprot:ELU10959.1 hypothetical protein CAPTEDRAFT_172884 [Capitella teleta]
MLVFTVLLKLTLNEFEDDDRHLLVQRSQNRPLAEADRAKWETHIIRSNVSRVHLHSVPSPKDPPIPLFSSEESQHLWPDYAYGDDRILSQLQYVPSVYRLGHQYTKVIYVPGGLGETPDGRTKFLSDECPVDNCRLTTNRSEQATAHAVLLQSGSSQEDMFEKPPGQIWILWLLESPMNTIGYSHLGNRVNWTATYRRDSTIVTPYEKFLSFANASAVIRAGSSVNYAAGKTKMAAWFVSNCGAKNQRWELVDELKQHFDVDIYGACGTFTCFRADKEKCFNMLSKDYKFYLSFENSNCRDYITEKFFWNALLNNVVPVVLGAHKEDYIAAAPPNSFIHIEDFPTVKALADHLKELNTNDERYSEYFRWKGSGSFINTKFWCRLCTLLHTVPTEGKVTWYENVDKWWKEARVCTHDRWDNPEAIVSNWPHF